MGGKKGFRGYPRQLRKNKGKGFKQCDASGFLRPVGSFVSDVRQGKDVIKSFADLTPGFGTHHPQDVVQLGVLDDPHTIQNASPDDKKNLTKGDLLMSDVEIEASIVEGRAPRMGY